MDEAISKADNDVVKTAVKRFKLAEEAENDTRKRALEELKFRAGDQWPDNIKQERALQHRPCITINQLPKFIRQVTNDARQNRPSIKVLPTADATMETAEVINGICRQIQSSSQADVAYDTACDQQVSIGFGYFRVLTEYCYDDSFDQEVKIKRIKNPFTVYFDPGAQEHDYSDAKWCFIVSDIPCDEFYADYDGKKKADYQLEATGNTQPDWMNEEYIRVAEYFRIEETPKKIYLLRDKRVIDDAEKQQLEEAGIEIDIVNERMTVERKVIWSKITALEELKTQEWPGRYIPIVPVLGEDYDIDGKRVIRGMVSDSMDAQRLYNYNSTAFTEALALAPKAPFVMAEGQDEGYERFWDNANTKAYSRLVYKPITIGEQIAPPPQRNSAEPPVKALALGIRQASEDLKGTTGIYDASMGAKGNETSGRAILARQQEGDTANFHYIDNLSRAIRYLGIILIDLIPKIYDAERVVRILHEDGESELIQVNSYFEDQKGERRIYDLTAGKYDVTVVTGPSFTTRRQEAAQAMVEVTQSYPKLMEVAGDLMIKNMEWPGAQEISERLKKLLPQELTQEEGEEPQIPKELQEQLAKQDEMIQYLTEALNKTQDTIDHKMSEIESKERMKNAELQNKLVLEQMKQEGGANRAILEKQLEAISARLDQLGNSEPVEQENPSQI